MKNFPLGEADELLTIYTREGGKMRAMARGVRRIRSRMAGALQNLNEVELETHARPDPGRGLPVVISARIRTLNEALRQNLKKFAFALVGAETLYRLTPDGEAAAPAYDALLRFLQDLTGAEEEKTVRDFQRQLLQIFGFISADWQGNVDEMLNEVMEREIKAKNFTKFLA